MNKFRSMRPDTMRKGASESLLPRRFLLFLRTVSLSLMHWLFYSDDRTLCHNILFGTGLYFYLL